MKYLIAGLGNIGAEYTETRHNIGFKVVDALAKAAGIAFETGRYGSVAELKYKGRTFILLKPSTYMNLSGKAVGYWLKTEKIPIENLFVVVDDIALPFGTLRIRGKGSDGGHNGLKNSGTTTTPGCVSGSAETFRKGFRWTTSSAPGQKRRPTPCPNGSIWPERSSGRSQRPDSNER